MTCTTVSSAAPHEITMTPLASPREFCVNTRTAGDDPLASFRNPRPLPSTILSQFVFGGRAYHQPARDLLSPIQWPVTWVHGDPCSGQNLGGTQYYCVANAPVRTICLDGQIVGRVYEDEHAQYCHLGGLLPTDVHATREAQTRDCFERVEAALNQIGMDFSHVVRTWLYLKRLLDWYREFNVVRNAFFDERHVFDGLVPASTGIGGGNPANAALTVAALAIRPKTDQLRIFAVPSPLQCPATEYRSAFSRAIEVDRPSLRQLYISGTASIAPDGKSVHQGDPIRQIDLSMAVAAAILHSRRMDWSNTTRLVAYFKHMSYLPHFTAWCQQHHLTDLPVVYSHADVCRDDLLFEVELDAATPNP